MKKTIITFIAGMLCTLIVVVGASIFYNAKDIEYSSKVDGWNPSTVEDAINDLYDLTNKFVIKYNYSGDKSIPTTFPKVTDGYGVEAVRCKGADASWDNKNWKLNLSNITGSSVDCEVDLIDFPTGQIWEYNYTGEYETFTVPVTGSYKIELWGSSGSNSSRIANGAAVAQGGKGAYASGNINLTKGTKLYVYVGSAGGINTSYGWNGGGRGSLDYSGSGGGATDIRVTKTSEKTIWSDITSLRSRIMVAGAGGGAGYNYNAGYGVSYGGAGGTYIGVTGQNSKSNSSYVTNTHAGGGTQTSGGTAGGYNGFPAPSAGTFGQGGFENTTSNFGGGGGAGYYGGGAGGTSNGSISSGAGGSSYISGHTGCVAVTSETNSTAKSGCSTGTTNIECSKHYSGLVFTSTEMLSGDQSMPTHDGKSKMTGNTGNGYAKITFISND